MQQVEPLPYQDIPQNKLQAKVLTNWSPMDVWVFGVTMLIMITTAVWLHVIGQDTLAMFAFLAEGAFLLPLNYRTPRGYGRLYNEIVSGLRGEFRQRVLRGVWWQADDTDSAFIRWLRYHNRKQGVIPLRLGEVRATINGKTRRACLLRELDRPYDHLYIGARGGAFARLDVRRQHLATNELAEITNRTIALADLKCGISYLRVRAPYDGTKPAQFLRENMDPTVMHPELFDLDDDTRAYVNWLREDAAQLRPVIEAFGAAETWYLIIITIKRSRSLEKVRKGKLGEEQLYNLPIIELGESLVESLNASSLLELEDVHCLGLAELSTFIRSSWDVTDIDAYYRDRAAGIIPRTDEEIDRIRQEHGDDAVYAALQTWPRQCIETPDSGDYIRLDGNYISTLRVTALPERVRADQFLGLHFKDKARAWSRLALVGQSISSDTETRNVVIGQSALINTQAAFFANRVVANPKWGRRNRQLAQQAQSVSAHSISQRFNMLASVVSDSTHNVADPRKHLSASLTGAGFQNEVATMPDRQLDVFITGCLGINRL